LGEVKAKTFTVKDMAMAKVEEPWCQGFVLKDTSLGKTDRRRRGW